MVGIKRTDTYFLLLVFSFGFGLEQVAGKQTRRLFHSFCDGGK